MIRRTTNTSRSPRATRGNAVTRVILVILGAILALCGLLVLLATVLMLFDGDFDGFFLMPFTLSSLVGGIYIIYMQVRERKGAEAPLKAPSQTAAMAPAPEIPVPAAPEPEPSPIPQRVDEQTAPKPAAPTPPAEKPQAASEPINDIAPLVSRATDLFASLRDLVRHDAAPGASPEKHHLATMLEAAGIMDWEDAPACEGGRLSRTGHYWIRLSVSDLDDTQYDTLVAAEAALSVNEDLPEIRAKDLNDPEAREAGVQLLRRMNEQRITKSQLTEEGLQACYHSTDASQTSHDWLVRSIICNASECIKTPFRVVTDLRVNLDDGLVVLDIETPRPRCFAIFTSDSATRKTLARAYALRLAVLMARHALDASERVTHVVTNCHEHANIDTLVSMDIDRNLLQSLQRVVGDATVETGFPSDKHIRATFENGWFAPVEPFVGLLDEAATPAQSYVFPELDTRPAPEAIVRTCHAQRICDLGINENAARVNTWNTISTQLGETTEQAVSTLKATRDSVSDITVAEACNRTMQALVSGETDLDKLDQMGTIFVDGSSLDRAVRRAADLLNDEGNHQDPEAALRVLKAALDPIDEMGVYLDDDTSVYRYFGSVSERVHHNRAVDEGGRTIRLVPDSYFNAHSNASIALGMMDRNAEALEHADVCLRLAPTSTFATLRKVRILEAESRIYEAADLIIAALRHAVTPRDASICHYRLAYMEWKLGREDLAAACYVRSLTWDTEMSSQAREELDDLIESMPDDEPPTSEQAEALLAREGIPLGCVRSDEERTLAAAVACIDSGALISARPLMAALYAMNGDDVVMDVYRSLNVLA